jgi:membrane protease subunit (stomatin/prohibitin family)
MGVFDFVKSGVKEMMIARPDNLKYLIVYKHPDQNIPMYSQLTVDSDEVAVFFKDGRVMGVLPPGRHTMQSQNIPFLNNLVTSFTGGNVFIAEVFFVTTRPVRDITFGGPAGDILDPMTGEEIPLRIFGEMAVAVRDPVLFVTGYVGQQSAAGDNNQILDWIKGKFMNSVVTVLTQVCEDAQKSINQVIGNRDAIAAAFMSKAPALNQIGLVIVDMGKIEPNIPEEALQRLRDAQAELAKAQRQAKIKQIGVAGAAADAQAAQFALDQKFQQDARYVQQLAGNYQNYAAGQAIIGAGQGMATHGVGGGGIAGMGAQMAVGVGMGNAMMGNMQQPQFAIAQGPVVAPGGTVTCGKCQKSQPGGKFCSDCGSPLAGAPKKFCTGCGQEVAPAAKFCANCGTSSVPAPQPSAP